MSDTLRKVLQLLEPGERWRLAGIVAGMVVVGSLQTLGIASIMPFLAVVANPTVVADNPYLSEAYRRLGFESTESFVVSLGVIFMVTMILSNGTNTLLGWLIVRFQWRAHARLSIRLLEVYVRAPYWYHLNENSARLNSTILEQVSQVTGGLFLPATNILSRAISSAFIIALLVAVDPRLALVVSLTIGGFYAVIYTFVRKKQGELGASVVALKTERFRVTNEAFGGIKELKVLEREDHFLDRFRQPAIRYSQARAASNLVGLLPKFALETLAYGGIVVVILYLLRTRATLDQVFPVLALYAFGANRLIPGLQEIFTSLAKIKYQAAAVDELYADLVGGAVPRTTAEVPRLTAGGSASVKPLPFRSGDSIRCENVTFCYPGARRPALSGINLEIPANRTSALVGATGSGKTTLVDLLLGLFMPTEGRILVSNRLLDEELLPAWRRAVGYVPQSIFLSDASIAENIAFGIPSDRVNPEAVQRAAQAAQLDSFVSTLEHGFDTIVGERGIRLSGGQRQRIGIARALYHDPALLVMDEATSALDNVTEDFVMQAIRELAQHRTILLIAHRLTTVQECDAIHVMEHGRIIASGTYDQLVETSAAFRAMARV